MISASHSYARSSGLAGTADMDLIQQAKVFIGAQNLELKMKGELDMISKDHIALLKMLN